MIKDNQKHFNRLHVVIDAFVIAASYVLAWIIRFSDLLLGEPDWVGILPVGHYMSALVLIVPGFLILYHAFNLYSPKRVQGRRLELANILKANALGVLLIMFVLYMTKENDFSRLMIYIFLCINVIAEAAVRMGIRCILRDMRKRGLNQKYVILVGYSRAAEEYIDRVIANPQWGYIIRGILDDNVAAGTTYRGVKVLGRIANLMVILPYSTLDEIAITLGLNEYYRLKRSWRSVRNPVCIRSLFLIIITSYRRSRTQRIFWGCR